MKLSHRSFPHPVVGNADDVPAAAFQAAITVHNDRVNYYVDVKLQSSSNTISKLVKKGDVVYVLHVECGNTLYRLATEFSETDREFMIPGECLNSNVELNVFAQAKKDLPKYRVEGAHEDYGDATFAVNVGDILAISEGYSFDADINFDMLRSIGSIMEIKQRDDKENAPMEIVLNYEKIRIYLSRADFENYKIIRVHQVLSASLIATIVLPALVEALMAMREDDQSDIKDTRWCRCLKRRIEYAGMSLATAPLKLAQDLLEMPIKRAFMSARAILESVE
jgi:hypothetical protein